MAVEPWRPFSRRLKDARRKPVKVFEYEDFPKEFRIKLDYALNGGLDPYVKVDPFQGIVYNPVWEIRHLLAEQHARYEIEKWNLGELVQDEDYTVVLDLIEITWLFVDNRDESAAETFTAKINDLFAQYALGYKLHEGQVLRVDAPALTEQAIEPALTLLLEPGFEQAEKEFRTALDHLKSNRAPDAVAWANASFESTLKVILHARKVSFDGKKETAKPLIDKVLSVPSLVPPDLRNYANNLAEVLLGLPTLRNRNPPAHGQGTSPSTLDRDEAQFALNLAATFIVFLVNRHRSLRK